MGRTQRPTAKRDLEKEENIMQNSKIITDIIVQRGYCVFGAGSSYDAAIADAANWIADPDTGRNGVSEDDVKEMIVADKIDGALAHIESGDEEFDSYLENQGGYTKTSEGWIED